MELYHQAAKGWFKFGFQVIPIIPRGKSTVVKWDSWLEDLSENKISSHWSQHPDHEVGAIVGDDLIVFDADSPEAIKALISIEEEYGVKPSMISGTRKGEHHFFRRAPGTFAKSDSHSTEEHPERIDVKTGRALIVLPPSTGKSVDFANGDRVPEFAEVNQNFIDSVFLMNGRDVPRQAAPLSEPRACLEFSSERVIVLKALLDNISPDCGYDDWVQVLMAICHETSGSSDGLKLADDWSSQGKQYKGRREVEAKWRSFEPKVANPVTIHTLFKRVDENGGDWMSIVAAVESPLEDGETIVIYPDDMSPETVKPEGTLFDKFSLTGLSGQLEKDAIDQVPVLGQIALLGQLTVLYAEGNTGKTLFTLKLLTESIQAERIDPAKVYYLNMDDNSHGLVEKLKIAEEFGFHMLAEGYRGFTAKAFLDSIRTLIKNDQARGMVVVLDTLKKFVDLMKNSDCRDFNVVLRQFSSKGGTVIALAHTNKNKAKDGRPIYSGTSAMKDDFDCVYMLSLLSERDSQEKIVLFEREKSRGPVVDTVSYSYIRHNTTNYNELFLSVQEVDESQIESIKKAEEFRSDTEIINAVTECINNGVSTKMKLAEAAAEASGASRRSVLQLIDKYTGNDPEQHRWIFVRGERGRQTYSNLEMETAACK